MFNQVPISEDRGLLPALVLRVRYYLTSDAEVTRKTDVSRYHSGGINDEIAALISLCLGVRLKSGGISRLFDPDEDPKGCPVAWEHKHTPLLLTPASKRTVLPQALGDHYLSNCQLLSKFPTLSPTASVALIRAARFYQDALWIVESDPELSWIMFVSAIETAAGYWRKEKEPAIERLRFSFPELEPVLLNAGGDALVQEVVGILSDFFGATRKFVDFILAYLPEPPEKRPSEAFQILWDKENLEKPLRTIYKCRSRALHSGVPFPWPMCQAPFKHDEGYDEKPLGLAASGRGGAWVVEDTPMLLHTFEYLVRCALLNWYRIQVEDYKATS